MTTFLNSYNVIVKAMSFVTFHSFTLPYILNAETAPGYYQRYSIELFVLRFLIPVTVLEADLPQYQFNLGFVISAFVNDNIVY